MYFKTSRYPRFTFTHAGSDSVTVEIMQQKITAAMKDKHVLFLHRDPRDVVVSYYFHLSKRVEKYTNMNLSEFLKDERFGITRIVSYYNFVDQQKSICKTFQVQTYENVLASPHIAFKNLIDYVLGDTYYNKHVFMSALEESSFQSMKEIEISGIVGDARLSSAQNSESEMRKVRKGKTGGYKNYFSEVDTIFADTVIQNLSDSFSMYKHYE